MESYLAALVETESHRVPLAGPDLSVLTHRRLPAAVSASGTVDMPQHTWRWLVQRFSQGIAQIRLAWEVSVGNYLSR